MSVTINLTSNEVGYLQTGTAADRIYLTKVYDGDNFGYPDKYLHGFHDDKTICLKTADVKNYPHDTFIVGTTKGQSVDTLPLRYENAVFETGGNAPTKSFTPIKGECGRKYDGTLAKRLYEVYEAVTVVNGRLVNFMNPNRNYPAPGGVAEGTKGYVTTRNNVYAGFRVMNDINLTEIKKLSV